MSYAVALGASAPPAMINPMPALPDGRKPHITSGYGPRTGGMYSFHYGVDMLYPAAPNERVLGKRFPWSTGKWVTPDAGWAAMPVDVPALAVAAGTVTKAQWTGTGVQVTIDHGGGWESQYMHMRDLKVRPGERVKQGTPLGRISFSPWKRGAPRALPPPSPPRKIGLNHLHLQIKRDGKTIDPKPLIRNAPVMPMPSRLPLLLAAGLAVAAGLYFSRFIR